MTGQTHLEAGSRGDYLRWCVGAIERGADALYCSGSLATVEFLAGEYIPIVGQVGLVPACSTWTGGFRAVGKTAESAMALFEEVKAYESAGAFAIELEVVPEEVATEISKRVDLLVWSMGAGAGCDTQYLFSNDILGYTEGHIPHHSKVYRDFRSEYGRLQLERIAAFREYVADVDTGAFPEDVHLVIMDADELACFRSRLPSVR